MRGEKDEEKKRGIDTVLFGVFSSKTENFFKALLICSKIVPFLTFVSE